MTTGEGSVLLLSDVHAHYGVIDAQAAHAQETWGRPVERVLVLGDFGLFGAELHRHFRRGGRRFSHPTAFIEGNHEDFAAFERLVRDYADVVTHLPRASRQRVGGWNCLCVGGARYMDAWSTPCGSEIRERDIDACLAHAPGSIDLVLSHDCPTGIGVTSESRTPIWALPAWRAWRAWRRTCGRAGGSSGTTTAGTRASTTGSATWGCPRAGRVTRCWNRGARCGAWSTRFRCLAGGDGGG
ncbi:MAG: metallophosphoesterase [bacterium]|nr:metallophosphoesterase [bacterium]